MNTLHNVNIFQKGCFFTFCKLNNPQIYMNSADNLLLECDKPVFLNGCLILFPAVFIFAPSRPECWLAKRL